MNNETKELLQGMNDSIRDIKWQLSHMEMKINNIDNTIHKYDFTFSIWTCIFIMVYMIRELIIFIEG